MKKHVLLLLAAAGCCATGLAQNASYFYPTDLSARTVEHCPLQHSTPGANKFVMTQTLHDPNGGENNNILFVHYALNTLPYINDTIIGHPEYDERNVDICFNPNTKNFFLVTSARHYPSGSHNFVRVHIITHDGIIITSNDFESALPAYGSLIPLDGAYDPVRNQYIVAGTAVKHISDYSPTATKVAFVARLDANLNVMNMRFYDSNPGLGQQQDYDIANKIIINPLNNGFYYITGSENVDKNGQQVMGIRNMLIHPVSLMPTIPGWHIPLLITDPHSEENSVDMVMAPDPTGMMALNVLSNSTSNPTGMSKWHMFRLDPSTGLPYAPNVALTLFGYDSYGHSIAEGNSSNEVVVSGMKFRYDDDCNKWDQEATPFMATVDVTASWTCSLINHIEYNTIMGSVAYWNIGDFYSPMNGYPVPSYLNNFADRPAPGREYSLAAPVKGIFSPLNTKLLRLAPDTKNDCEIIHCSYGMDYKEKVIDVYPVLKYYTPSWKEVKPQIRAWDMDYEFLTCSDWYKPGQTTAVGEMENSRQDFHIYPNPVTSEITVELPADYKGRNTQIALYDVVGKQIAMLHNGTIEKTTLKLELPQTVTTGIYLIQINTGDQEAITKKITVDR